MKDEGSEFSGDPTFAEYSIVKVKKLLHSADYYDGWKINQRPPQIGDVGTIVDVLRLPNLPVDYIVEGFDCEGRTVWVSDFLAEEIEGV
jgi:hypothetical protein